MMIILNLFFSVWNEFDKKSGLLNEITSILDKNNIRVVEHPGVKSNPVVSHANSGVSLAKKHKVNAILAVGGGSVLDESKAIAAGAKTDCDVWDFIQEEMSMMRCHYIYFDFISDWQ